MCCNYNINSTMCFKFLVKFSVLIFENIILLNENE